MSIISVNNMKAGGACGDLESPYIGNYDMHVGGCWQAEPANCADCAPILRLR